MHYLAPAGLAVTEGPVRNSLLNIYLAKNVLKDGALRMMHRPLGENPAPDPTPLDRRIYGYHFRAAKQCITLALKSEQLFVEMEFVITKHGISCGEAGC